MSKARATRYSGLNRMAWTNADYDRAYQSFTQTLEPSERVKKVAEMHRLVSENLPGFTLYFSQANYTWVAALKGPPARVNSGFGTVSKPTTQYWNLQTWEFDR